MKTSIQDRRNVARLVRLLRQCAPRRPRRVFLEEAEIELWGLYRREQAELVREAAALRVPPLDEAGRRARVAALRAWRARAAEHALLAACDGYPLAGALHACLALPAHDWPSARWIAAGASTLGGLAADANA